MLIDKNAAGTEMVDDPIENVIWKFGTFPKRGHYTEILHRYFNVTFAPYIGDSTVNKIVKPHSNL